MNNIAECAYNMDNSYIEVWFTDGNRIREKCEEVEVTLKTTERSLTKLYKLLDNKLSKTVLEKNSLRLKRSWMIP